jgi:hypothetical protein
MIPLANHRRIGTEESTTVRLGFRLAMILGRLSRLESRTQQCRFGPLKLGNRCQTVIRRNKPRIPCCYRRKDARQAGLSF